MVLRQERRVQPAEGAGVEGEVQPVQVQDVGPERRRRASHPQGRAARDEAVLHPGLLEHAVLVRGLHHRDLRPRARHRPRDVAERRPRRQQLGAGAAAWVTDTAQVDDAHRTGGGRGTEHRARRT